MARRLVQFGLWLLLATLSAGAFAQPRAWLDRERIHAGETVTLNIELVGSVGGRPDYGPLHADFQVTGSTSNSQVVPNQGGLSVRSLYAVSLAPKRSGRIDIPALQVAGQRTRPLQLEVVADAGGTPQGAGADVFIESEGDDLSPYVQQAVGWVVRLYAAVPLLSGKIDQPAPDGASLMRVGDDAQYSRDLGGRRYTVVERRFLLVPERSGALTVPPAVFEGRSAPGMIDQMMGGSGDEQRARTRPRTLEVQALPANAPQPWLPLRALSLRYRTAPQELRAGGAASLVIEARVDGAGAAQLPELQLPPIDGVQVFPEPVQADESFVVGRPRVVLTRKFSLVPARAGAVRLDGVRMDWWDVGAGQARSATLPPLNWNVLAGGAPSTAPGAAPRSSAPVADGVAADALATETGAGAGPAGGKLWAVAAFFFAALWLATLLWALHLRAHPAASPAASAAKAAQSAAPNSKLAKPSAALRELLDRGDFEQIAAALRAAATPPAADDDELVERLADPLQREAVQALRRARWGGGDGVAARALLRDAFARGPRWQAPETEPDSPLAPLYPPRRGA
ncbi:BatD family protein [Lysobacter firmicutimachus]|uniref:BatD family protein n=1 Tax=Lysobacter firmicutimachus TaxID=1792846 RepID=A0AAU8MXQ4_9GAMM